MGPINFPSTSEVLFFLFIIFAIGGCSGWLIFGGNKKLKSTYPITPSLEIKATYEDGVVKLDTTYIYEKPN